ncbi:MAG: hypothetical protein E3K36_01470 [Candidatus Brocadia sp.]|nr:hypothetical protein [Candidatus Brocadia sp.]
MRILDTQIISYALKGKSDLPKTKNSISSISANEFLLVQGENLVQASYYVPLLSRYRMGKMFGFSEEQDYSNHKLRIGHPFSKRSTDQIILYFGYQFPTIVEYGSLAISMLINKKVLGLFDEAIQFLPKTKRKKIRKRYDFLLDNDVQCVPLTKQSVAVALTLFQEFIEKYNLKANFRNSVNDILILASAIDSSVALMTDDLLLKEFSSDKYQVPITQENNFSVIDFSDCDAIVKKIRSESKGYINKGWQARFRNYGHKLITA